MITHITSQDRLIPVIIAGNPRPESEVVLPHHQSVELWGNNILPEFLSDSLSIEKFLFDVKRDLLGVFDPRFVIRSQKLLKKNKRDLGYARLDTLIGTYESEIYPLLEHLITIEPQASWNKLLLLELVKASRVIAIWFEECGSEMLCTPLIVDPINHILKYHPSYISPDDFGLIEDWRDDMRSSPEEKPQGLKNITHIFSDRTGPVGDPNDLIAYLALNQKSLDQFVDENPFKFKFVKRD